MRKFFKGLAVCLGLVLVAAVPVGTRGLPVAGLTVVWVDANGVVISPLILYASGLPIYIDDAGQQWRLDTDAATLLPFGKSPHYYLETGCTGPAYVDVFAPRQVFFVATGARMRAEDAPMQTVTIRSLNWGSECSDLFQPGGRVIPESGLIAAGSTPSLGAVPPLHLERR